MSQRHWYLSFQMQLWVKLMELQNVTLWITNSNIYYNNTEVQIKTRYFLKSPETFKSMYDRVILGLQFVIKGVIIMNPLPF